MNDLSYLESLSDKAILKKIGNFIKEKRVQQNISQEELAEKTAMSRSTLSLMERGQNYSILNLLKVLRILDALYVLDAFQVVKPISPLLLAKEEEKRRKRAYKTHKNDTEGDLGW